MGEGSTISARSNVCSNSDHQPCETHRGQMQAARLGCETNIALGLGFVARGHRYENQVNVTAVHDW